MRGCSIGCCQQATAYKQSPCPCNRNWRASKFNALRPFVPFLGTGGTATVRRSWRGRLAQQVQLATPSRDWVIGRSPRRANQGATTGSYLWYRPSSTSHWWTCCIARRNHRKYPRWKRRCHLLPGQGEALPLTCCCCMQRQRRQRQR